MTNTTPSAEASHNTVVPSEVGWQFVPQYYTFVNKQPNRLHCFYTKSSTFIHGTEGEDGKPAFGQQVCVVSFWVVALDLQLVRWFYVSAIAWRLGRGMTIVRKRAGTQHWPSLDVVLGDDAQRRIVQLILFSVSSNEGQLICRA